MYQWVTSPLCCIETTTSQLCSGRRRLHVLCQVTHEGNTHLCSRQTRAQGSRLRKRAHPRPTPETNRQHVFARENLTGALLCRWRGFASFCLRMWIPSGSGSGHRRQLRRPGVRDRMWQRQGLAAEHGMRGPPCIHITSSSPWISASQPTGITHHMAPA